MNIKYFISYLIFSTIVLSFAEANNSANSIDWASAPDSIWNSELSMDDKKLLVKIHVMLSLEKTNIEGSITPGLSNRLEDLNRSINDLTTRDVLALGILHLMLKMERDIDRTWIIADDHDAWNYDWNTRLAVFRRIPFRGDLASFRTDAYFLFRATDLLERLNIQEASEAEGGNGQ